MEDESLGEKNLSAKKIRAEIPRDEWFKKV
jgi:hypothetical protein